MYFVPYRVSLYLNNGMKRIYVPYSYLLLGALYATLRTVVPYMYRYSILYYVLYVRSYCILYVARRYS